MKKGMIKTLISTVALIVLAHPIINILFEQLKNILFPFFFFNKELWSNTKI